MPKMPPKVPVDESFAFLFTCIDATGVKPDFKVVGDLIGLAPAAARMRYSRLRKAVESGDYKNAILTQPLPTSRRMVEIATSDTDCLPACEDTSHHRRNCMNWVSDNGDEQEDLEYETKDLSLSRAPDTRKRKAESPGAQAYISPLFFPDSSREGLEGVPRDTQARQPIQEQGGRYLSHAGYRKATSGHQAKRIKHENAASSLSSSRLASRSKGPADNAARSAPCVPIPYGRPLAVSRNPYDPPSMQNPQSQYPHFPPATSLPQFSGVINPAISSLSRANHFSLEVPRPLSCQQVDRSRSSHFGNSESLDSATLSAPVSNRYSTTREGLASILDDFEPARRWGDPPLHSPKCSAAQAPMSSFPASLDPQLQGAFTTSNPYIVPSRSPTVLPDTRNSAPAPAPSAELFTPKSGDGIPASSSRCASMEQDNQDREAAGILTGLTENQDSCEGAGQAQLRTADTLGEDNNAKN